MLAIAIATLLLGPRDFGLTRTELTTLNELRETTPDIRRTIDLLTLREGMPVSKERIPAAELAHINEDVDNVLKANVRPSARNWVGNRTKDFENETIDLTWKFGGQPILWADFEGNAAVMFRNPAEVPLIRSNEDAQTTLQEIMTKMLDLPKGATPYQFYLKKPELPSGGTALTGYGTLYRAERDSTGLPFDVPKEKEWAVSIQVIVVDRLVIFRFSHPMGGQGGGGQKPRPADYRRPYSRFNPPG